MGDQRTIDRLRGLERAAHRYRDAMMRWELCTAHPDAWHNQEQVALKAATLALSGALNSSVFVPEPVRESLKALAQSVDAHRRELDAGERPHARDEGGRVAAALGALTEYLSELAAETSP